MRKFLIMLGLILVPYSGQAVPNYKENPNEFCSELKRITGALASLHFKLVEMEAHEMSDKARGDAAETAVIYNALCKN